MKAVFNKKFWKIKRAQFRVYKFQYFYSWQNVLRAIFALVFMPIFTVFITIPKWILDKLENFISDNMPHWLKISENPEWIKHTWQDRKEFLDSLKDWK